ncbi:hypothetical protein [Klebsiella oxytoca]|uniref:hypothetical protein n=1 Tax=Klebsiella oxytoca TaxID=571 RepID=UPI00115C02A2|nr:hypothetical protein [Klebsiella oxytoca]
MSVLTIARDWPGDFPGGGAGAPSPVYRPADGGKPVARLSAAQAGILAGGRNSIEITAASPRAG